MKRTLILRATLMVMLTALLFWQAGCKEPIPEPIVMPDEEPQYSKPLEEGAFGLIRVTDDPQYRPDLASVVAQVGERTFQQAAQRSLQWFAIASTRQFYPVGPITHDQSLASVFALKTLASLPEQERAHVLQEDFDIWMSVGWDQRGTVFYTGYYSPIFEASRTRTQRFRYPLYQRPLNLVSDPITGKVEGVRTAEGRIITPPTRRQYEEQPELNGLTGRELVYLSSRLDAYIIEVNGSARLRMPDGTTMDIGFAGTNGYPYTSIRQKMVEDDRLSEKTANLISMRNYFRENPVDLDHYIRQNDRMVFFQQYAPGRWPAGSLGVTVTAMRSLATDKAIFPRGNAVLVDTRIGGMDPASDAQWPFTQLMLDQDTGGAIRAPGRGDIYMGVGQQVEHMAGTTASEGRLYYLILKPEKISGWLTQATAPQ